MKAAITFLEDSPLFNAGKGAVFTTDAANELDASIMDGETLDAGAVTGVQHIKNPLTLARALMEHSRHVMLAGEGAELYASHRGMRLVTQDYFFTQRRVGCVAVGEGRQHRLQLRRDGHRRRGGARPERRPCARDVDRAAQGALDQVAELGGPNSGGLIALDKDGNLAMPFNTDGMFRGYAMEDG